MPVKREFVRYVGVGGIAFVADFALFAALTLAGLHYLLAASLAFLLGTWVNYQLSVRWVFRYRSVAARRVEFGVFLLIGLISLGLSLALMALLVEWAAMHVLIAKCAVAAFTLGVNFAGRRAVLFTRWQVV
jgi:putative flippase GtrA